MIVACVAGLIGATAVAAQTTGGATRPPPVATDAGARAIVIARPASHTLSLDARLDDSVWAAADSISDFRQREPEEGLTATERTVVKVLRDHDALYVAVRAYDAMPARIRATQLRRDADLSTDDNVTLLIDSFHDRRGAFLFQTNPNGARWDAQVINQDNINQDWNGIWDVATSHDARGWAAVFRIPFRTLRFDAGGGAAFGFNVRRFIRRKNEEDLWRSWHRTEGPYQLLHEGELGGLGGISRSRDIDILPYALGQARQSAHDSVGGRIGGAGVDGKVGVDAKIAISPTVTADLTVNTDFAQVEVDSQVINLTRFPTFFPEKREFFLESSGIFDFGTSQSAQVFYSRRIGLSDSGTAVPILGGVRTYGKVGSWTIGALDARTGGVDGANDAVVRVKHDLLDRAYVGAIGTVRSGPSVHGYDAAGGIDADFPLVVHGHNVEPALWVAGTQTPDTSGVRTAWRVSTDYPNDLFDNFVSLYRIDSGFAPTLGFIRRTGIWEATGHIDFTPRPHVLGIRQLDFEIPSWDIIATEHGFVTRTHDWQTAAIRWLPLSGDLQNGDHFELGILRFFDAPPTVFEIFRGVDVAPGRYWWTQSEVQYQTSVGRPWSALAHVSWGRLYDGRSVETDIGGTWRTGGHLIIGASMSRTEAQLGGGHFVAMQATGRIEYAFSTRADFLGFAQFDNVLNRTDFDLRFHWIPVIGDDLFVVWNSGYTTDPLSRYRFPDARSIRRPLTGSLVFKVVHRIAP